MTKEERMQAAQVLMSEWPFECRAREQQDWLPAEAPCWNFKFYEYRIKPLSLEEYHSLPWVNDWARWRVIMESPQGLLIECKDRPTPTMNGNWWVSGQSSEQIIYRPLEFPIKDSLQQREVAKRYRPLTPVEAVRFLGRKVTVDSGDVKIRVTGICEDHFIVPHGGTILFTHAMHWQDAETGEMLRVEMRE